MLKRRPGGGGVVQLRGERKTLTSSLSDIQSPMRGWNWLSLGGRGDAAPVDRRAKLQPQQVPVLRVRPKPARAVLPSNPAMARKLAEHSFKPWWLR